MQRSRLTERFGVDPRPVGRRNLAARRDLAISRIALRRRTTVNLIGR
jgi:hypothetical protein